MLEILMSGMPFMIVYLVFCTVLGVMIHPAKIEM